jgi:ATP-dependent DNA ligase
LLEQSFRRRREILQSYLPPTIAEDPQVAKFDHVAGCDKSKGRAALEEFFETSIENKAEGLMIKVRLITYAVISCVRSFDDDGLSSWTLRSLGRRVARSL